MLTDFKQLDLTKRYTYADYLTWQFDDMVEIIKGKVFIYQLDDQGEYQLLRKTPFLKHETAPAGIFSDFEVHLDRVFG